MNLPNLQDLLYMPSFPQSIDPNWIRKIVVTATRLSPLGRVATREVLSAIRTQASEQDGQYTASTIAEKSCNEADILGASILTVNPRSTFSPNTPVPVSMKTNSEHVGQHTPIVHVGCPPNLGTINFSGYGKFGGQFVPESIMGFLHELQPAVEATLMDPSFWAEYKAYQRAQPTPLEVALKLTDLASENDRNGSAATIWLKRDDRNDYGSHKSRNIIGQLLLARRMGRKQVVTDCASAKHGIFTAKMCRDLGLHCVVVMGVEDAFAQVEGVHAMVVLGARILTAGSPGAKGTLRAAITEALRYFVCNHETTYYLTGGPIGPAPLPALNRKFQALLGEEVMVQMHEATSRQPDALVVAIGSGSGAVGLFSPFIPDSSVRLVGVEAARAAVLKEGSPGVLQGARTLLLQNHDGQIFDSDSISPDLNFSAVGPEIAHWKEAGRIEIHVATDEDAKAGFQLLNQHEGIQAGLDSSHAVKRTIKLAKELGCGKNIVLLVTGADNGESIRSQLVSEVFH